MAKRLGFDERKKIEQGLKKGLPYTEIEKQIGFHNTTIRSEVVLNSEPTGYTAEGADRMRKKRYQGQRW